MGAYSELDAALREGGDVFVDDDAFEEDNDSCATVSDGSGNVPQAEPVFVPPVQSVEPQSSAPAQSVDDKADKAAQEQTDEDAKRKAHEEAEAKRKAEWQAEKKKKKEAEKPQIVKIDNMSNDEVLAAALKRVGEDTEKLTRRHMMECVMEHIQTLCLDDPAFARKVMHPRKNMIRCYQYICRKAWEYVEDEIKAKGIVPSREVPYGSVIPDDLCYQWAEDYFNDPSAKEDKEKEEKFVPKSYLGKSTASSKSTAAKRGTAAKAAGVKDAAPKETKPAASKKRDDGGQITFGGFAMQEEKAG